MGKAFHSVALLVELHIVLQLFGDGFLGHSVAIDGHSVDINKDADEQNKDNHREKQVDLLVMIAHKEEVELLVKVLNALLLHVHLVGLHAHQRCFVGRDEGRL